MELKGKNDIDNMFQKVNQGIVEYRKAKVLDVLKIAWIVVWTITIFPLLVFWDWVFNDCAESKTKNSKRLR